jgi:hypothetical protein
MTMCRWIGMFGSAKGLVAVWLSIILTVSLQRLIQAAEPTHFTLRCTGNNDLSRNYSIYKHVSWEATYSVEISGNTGRAWNFDTGEWIPLEVTPVLLSFEDKDKFFGDKENAEQSVFRHSIDRVSGEYTLLQQFAFHGDLLVTRGEGTCEKVAWRNPGHAGPRTKF